MSADLVFARERLQDIANEVASLWRAHWQETEGYRHVQPYEPDFMQYARMEQNGMFAEYTARIDGKLVGHIGYIIHKSRHTSKLNAVEDYFYLLPEARRGFWALQLLRYAIADLKRIGCAQIGMSSKLTNDIRPLLKRVGFEHVAEFHVMNVPENL